MRLLAALSSDQRAELVRLLGSSPDGVYALREIERQLHIYAMARTWPRDEVSGPVSRLVERCGDAVAALRGDPVARHFVGYSQADEAAKLLEALVQDARGFLSSLPSSRSRPSHRPSDSNWKELCRQVAWILRAGGFQATTAAPTARDPRAQRGALLWRVLEVVAAVAGKSCNRRTVDDAVAHGAARWPLPYGAVVDPAAVQHAAELRAARLLQKRPKKPRLR